MYVNRCYRYTQVYYSVLLPPLSLSPLSSPSLPSPRSLSLSLPFLSPFFFLSPPPLGLFLLSPLPLQVL